MAIKDHITENAVNSEAEFQIKMFEQSLRDRAWENSRNRIPKRPGAVFLRAVAKTASEIGTNSESRKKILSKFYEVLVGLMLEGSERYRDMIAAVAPSTVLKPTETRQASDA
ncbi:MAG TPA: hypothetical protein VMT99_03610 [Candidatus Paceibacterota bacterium]|nr:hypothetical protein [Candidatus Paceibacterota bacterium]